MPVIRGTSSSDRKKKPPKPQAPTTGNQVNATGTPNPTSTFTPTKGRYKNTREENLEAGFGGPKGRSPQKDQSGSDFLSGRTQSERTRTRSSGSGGGGRKKDTNRNTVKVTSGGGGRTSGTRSPSGGGGGGGGTRDLNIRNVRDIGGVRPTDGSRGGTLAGSMRDRDLVGSFNEIDTFEEGTISSVGGGGGGSGNPLAGREGVTEKIGRLERLEGRSVEEVVQGARRQRRQRRLGVE